ncbi:DUF4345 domain-containing protein [Dokdonia sp. Hel_I_53]|uniref:DUF4345 domain-containing protein n=1 Tax=Dokdonia sp. Hel_I_53 TaxID=1566287 RepID=UPI00119C4439|nr:DUF4345 domain-containing protein [Dokdonia sp. Hel_I_53]TVZ50900.1 uncharacterized protein DUF4345 [Dokdonia sp. Hel_I_53]
MSKLPQNLHLGVSSFIVLLMAFVYGANPSGILPYIFGFEVEDIELKNIFRAIMGLYMAFGGYWIYGLFHKSHWRSATLANILFMSGLVFGRVLSTILDGWSPQYGIGMVGEAVLMWWGYWNLKYYK